MKCWFLPRLDMLLCICVLATWPMEPRAQADSVSAGRFKGNSRIMIGSNNFPPKSIEPGGTLGYLLNGVLMQSTSFPFDQRTTSFGSFKNNSSYPLTITLTHVGGNRRRHANVYVDGSQVGHSEGGQITFVVPQNSTYGWQVKNEHTITVISAAGSAEFLQTGLPVPSNFQFPQRRGKYLGCVYGWGVSDLSYFYEPSPMSDGSDAWGGEVHVPGLGGVVEGPIPTVPSTCLNDPPSPESAPNS